MDIKIEFTLKNGTKKIVGIIKNKYCFFSSFCYFELYFKDMEHTIENFKSSRKYVINRCEQYLCLEGVKSEKQDQV